MRSFVIIYAIIFAITLSRCLQDSVASSRSLKATNSFFLPKLIGSSSGLTPVTSRGTNGLKNQASIGAEGSSGVRSQQVETESMPMFPHIPIKPQLMQAFRRYQGLHADILAGRAPQKYFVYRTGGQLCNVLRGTMAAFLFSLLTDRALLVENDHSWYNNYYDVFEKPGFDIQFDRNVHGNLVGARTQMPLDMDRDWENLLCRNLTEQWQPDVIRVHGGAKYFSPFIYRNPHYQQVMQDLFIEGGIARALFALLFRPVKEVWDLKNNFIQTKFSASRFRVTMHIRTEHFPTDDEWKAYADCATAVTPHTSRDSSLWFVATDTQKSRDHFSRIWSWKKPLWLEASHDGLFKKAGNNVLAQRQAVADMLIAAEGDKIMLSPSSSYSNMISLIARTDQLILVTDRRDVSNAGTDADPHKQFTTIAKHCYRFQSREPCSWHGPVESFSSRITKAKCYTPDMVMDYC